MSDSKDIWVTPYPIPLVEGATTQRSIEYEGVTNLSNPSWVVWINGTDTTSTVESGAFADTNNVLTLKALTAQTGDGGKEYVAVITVTADGETDVRKLQFEIIDPAQEM